MLIPTREILCQFLLMRHLDPQGIHKFTEARLLMFPVYHPPAGKLRQVRKTEIFPDRMHKNEPLALAVLRQQANTRPNRLTRVFQIEGLPIETYRP